MIKIIFGMGEHNHVQSTSLCKWFYNGYHSIQYHFIRYEFDSMLIVFSL